MGRHLPCHGLVAKLGPDRLEMQRQRVVDGRPDAMLRQVRLEGVAVVCQNLEHLVDRPLVG